MPFGLNERYTWRHNEVLRVFKKKLDEKRADTNNGKIPATKMKKKKIFIKKDKRKI